jgi:hypothetical protein
MHKYLMCVKLGLSHKGKSIDSGCLRTGSKAECLDQRDEVTGEWRKLHSEELHILYSSPNIIRQIKSRRMRWAGHVARMREDRNVYRVLMGKPEGKRLLGRLRRRYENGITMDICEIGWRVLSGSSWLRIVAGGGLL